MARRTVHESIRFSDGTERRFELTQFKVKDGHAVIERLLRVGAPVLGVLAGNLGAGAGDAVIAGDLKADGIGEAFDTFAGNLIRNEGVLDWLTDKVRKTARVETETEDVFVALAGDVYDETFAGEYAAEAALVIAALRLNFASFFGAAGGLGDAARRFVTSTQSRSTSPQV